ncbi:hypothetical protein LguiA_006626 [Lonicera macranthoides]
MDGMDADMMDTEAAAAAPSPPLPSSACLLQSQQSDVVRGFLTLARQLIDQGKPSQALQAGIWNLTSVKLNLENSKYKTYLSWLHDPLYSLPSCLDNVVMATRTKGGDEAVIQSLSRARELYRNKIQASTDADELASLFAECAIAEALPSNSESSSQSSTVSQPIEPDVRGNSILTETGRKQIMLDAFSDGSSFVCLQCGGLVSNHRREEHYAFWCCNI